ncbi:membrane cofactor protein isoform X1 [Castor canadensis]|uniref:Membrane cofactor protein n=1 Tax=Castor canadensis TaxID=51338 RepID=A0A8B7UF27_CASCN|nr:membrane cofactor protein isoform X3 [Castor canadensis]
MMASSAPRTTPLRCGVSPSAFQWFLIGIFAVAVAVLLSPYSDACELPPPFEGMEPTTTPKPYYEVGEKLQYKCKKGYLYLLPYLTIATCERNHSWTPITDDGCLKHQCNFLYNPPYGQVHYITGGFSWGNKVLFTCHEGYYLIGNATLNCELKDDDAFWDSNPPRCEKILCAPPPKIKNGTHTFTDIEVFKYREAVVYSCDRIPGPDQFSLVGKSMLYCAGHGVWSSAAPECKVVKCPFPVVENGKQVSGFAKKFSYNATVMFECNKGYYFFNDSDIATCDSNSTWHPWLPRCLKVPPPPSKELPSFHSVPTPPSTKPPISTVSGYPNPREGLFDQELDAWIIALIIIIAIVAVAVMCLFLYRFFENRKKGKTEVRVQYTTCQKKSSISAEQIA